MTIDPFDDYPIHQTPEPISVPATSDSNFYDRTWFNGYATDASAYFGLGLALYPHRRIIDGAFSVVTAEGRQHAVIASGRAPAVRSDTSIGPLRIEVVEPLRRTRVVVDDNETGIACDLTFSARTSPIREGRQTLWDGSQRMMDATRFDQFGRWTGTVVTPDGELTVDEHTWRGTKDRSWGIRSSGTQPAAAPGDLQGIFFLWAPIVWDDHVSHAIFFDDPSGGPLVREALTAPVFATAEEVSNASTTTMMATTAHRVSYRPGTRYASSAEIDMVASSGSIRTIHLEPRLRFQMKGLGYTHPTWSHGGWHGELAVHGESFVIDDLDPLAFENIHVQQIVTATDGDRMGIGVLEQACIGPYAPAGFTDINDGYSGEG